MKERQTINWIDRKVLSFKTSWEYQTKLLERLKNNKKLRLEKNLDKPVEHFLLSCEHNHVYTLGKSGKQDHLLIGKSELALKGIEFFKINRGGDITYHGPGQLTIYPILDLDLFFNDVHKYVRLLEEVVILSLKSMGIRAKRLKGYTGVWLDDAIGQRKICAIGVHMSRWVTMHGFALNVSNDLKMFKHIIPCGISSSHKSVTSIEKELNQKIDFSKVKTIVLDNFSKVFDVHIKPITYEGI